MKKLALAAFIGCIASTASAQVYHRGYVRQDGTYVQPHWQSSPNSTPNDNWSSRPNVNPMTGREGTRNPQPTYNPYQQPSQQRMQQQMWGRKPF